MSSDKMKDSSPPQPPSDPLELVVELDWIPSASQSLHTLTIPSSTAIWELSPKEARQAGQLLTGNVVETKSLRQLHVPIIAAETVVYIYLPDVLENGSWLAVQHDLSSIPRKRVQRLIRSAMLTPGSLQLKAPPSWSKKIFGPRGIPNVKFGILQLRGIHMTKNVMIAAYAPLEASSTKKEEYALFQSPVPNRLLDSLVAVTIAAYIGTPNWAIPISWSGELPDTLTPVTDKQYDEWMGSDGGFSSYMYAAVVAYHVQAKVPIIPNIGSGGRAAMSWFLPNQKKQAQSPPTSSRLGIQTINLTEYIKLIAENLNQHDPKPDPARPKKRINVKKFTDSMICHALEGMAFNLIFRHVRLNDYQPALGQPTIPFQDALAKVVRYNVTLRSVDLSGTTLTGMGTVLGRALVGNVQPLIAQLNLSRCGLTSEDLLGLLPGLTRTWAGSGASALVERIQFRGNSGISAETWNSFFLALVEKSTVPSRQGGGGTVSNFGFLQELDLCDTSAVGPGLVTFLQHLTGLRSLAMCAPAKADMKQYNSQALDVVLKSKAPLRSLHAQNLDDTSLPVLLALGDTLKSLVLDGYSGDATPLLCGWPNPRPQLTLEFSSATGSLLEATANAPTDTSAGYSPGCLRIEEKSNFGPKVIRGVLSIKGTGLIHLRLGHVFYSALADAAPVLAFCGLESLHILNAPALNPQKPWNQQQCQTFWDGLAPSTTLQEILIPDQLRGGPDELAMVGYFLKKNRSVQRIHFDSRYGSMDVKSVMVLRSAFYGNKKVIELQYPRKCQDAYMYQVQAETGIQLAEIATCKASIKSLFKKHYDKFNSNWRTKPHSLKGPFVDRIRVAKRKIGQLERDARKIASLLEEIREAVSRNCQTQHQIQREKEAIKISRRENQLKNLGRKKQKVLAKLITRLHEAKRRGRRNQSAKPQVSRSSYYKSPNRWHGRRSRDRRDDGYWDGYYAGYYGGYYGGYYYYYNCPYDHHYHHPPPDNGQQDDGFPIPPIIPDMTPGEGSGGFLSGLIPDIADRSPVPSDPWSNIDDLISPGGINSGGLYQMMTSPAHLAAIHAEASELGPDVVADISGFLDTFAEVNESLDGIATNSGIARSELDSRVDDSLDAQMDFAMVQSTLDNVPEYDDAALSLEIDGVVDMYAGAGPRDLGGGNGGPSNFDTDAILAGRRARRQKQKLLRRQRGKARTQALSTIVPYSALNLSAAFGHENDVAVGASDRPCEDWPAEDLVIAWRNETRHCQIQAMSRSDLFVIPDVADREPHLIMEWSTEHTKERAGTPEIDVALVTQCSLDRLQNLEAQLSCWGGKASVAIYLKPQEDFEGAKKAILHAVERARFVATASSDKKRFDVAVSIVPGCLDDEPYPINYLRNVALLEARRQQHRANTSLAECAVLLLDVDFRPSENLYSALHSNNAAESILGCQQAKSSPNLRRRVVICPAFETKASKCPTTLKELWSSVQREEAEGFHLSHFPQGHEPTRFDEYWMRSRRCWESGKEWDELYLVEYHDYFEPYIVMPSLEVPFYDERFTGYGLNKVAHLATISKRNYEFCVLPGVFVVAPVHERSDSWKERYLSGEKRSFNQLWLKGLYATFTRQVLSEPAGEPVISNRTREKDSDLREARETQTLPQDIQRACPPDGNVKLDLVDSSPTFTDCSPAAIRVLT